jgi:hypothetical protein
MTPTLPMRRLIDRLWGRLSDTRRVQLCEAGFDRVVEPRPLCDPLVVVTEADPLPVLVLHHSETVGNTAN